MLNADAIIPKASVRDPAEQVAEPAGQLPLAPLIGAFAQICRERVPELVVRECVPRNLGGPNGFVAVVGVPGSEEPLKLERTFVGPRPRRVEVLQEPFHADEREEAADGLRPPLEACERGDRRRGSTGHVPASEDRVDSPKDPPPMLCAPCVEVARKGTARRVGHARVEPDPHNPPPQIASERYVVSTNDDGGPV
jgi:hypothetical protein